MLRWSDTIVPTTSNNSTREGAEAIEAPQTPGVTIMRSSTREGEEPEAIVLLTAYINGVNERV